LSLVLARSAAAAPPFSIELDGFASYTTLSPYSDAATLFDPWVDPADPDVSLPNAQLSVDNYPLLGVQAQATTFLRAYPGWREGTPDNRPVVNYRVTWDGGGLDANDQPVNNVSFVNRALTDFTSTLVNGVRKNSATLAFQYDGPTGEGSLALRIDNALPGVTTPVSNLRIIPTQYIDPVTGQAPTFRQEFLRKISPFKVLRMMDWQQTNSGGLADLTPTPAPFDDPRTVDWVHQNVDLPNGVTVQGRAVSSIFSRTGIKGVPYEEIVHLANVSKKDLWINIPDRATTNYVTQLGALMADTLDPGVNVYVEFSNELWNTGNTQRSARVLQDALADTSGPVPVNDGQDLGNNLRHVYREAAKKLVDFSDVLKTQLGPARAAKVKPVLAGQTPTPTLLKYGLEYLALKYENAPAGQGADLSPYLAGVAIAPYVGNDINNAEPVKTVPNGTPVLGPDGQPVLDPAGNQILGPDPTGRAQSLDNTPEERARYLDWLFPNLQNHIDTQLRADVKATRQLADKYNLKVLSYEGGQHLIAFNGAFGEDLNSDFKIAANRDPRMGLLYRDLIQMWADETGNGLFNQFSLSSPYSSFGSWGLTESLDQSSSPKWDAILDLLAGDANLDGAVDFADFQTLEAHFNQADGLWGHGDFNLDGAVDYNDFLIFRTRFQPTGAPPAQAMMIEAFAVANVPEPATAAAAIALAGIGALTRRRRAS
jgi:hypothetical protein